MYLIKRLFLYMITKQDQSKFLPFFPNEIDGKAVRFIGCSLFLWTFHRPKSFKKIQIPSTKRVLHHLHDVILTRLCVLYKKEDFFFELFGSVNFTLLCVRYCWVTRLCFNAACVSSATRKQRILLVDHASGRRYGGWVLSGARKLALSWLDYVGSPTVQKHASTSHSREFLR